MQRRPHPGAAAPPLPAAPPQDDPTEQIFVFFPEEAKVGVKTIKLLAERMRNEGVQRAVMVTQANMTPFAKQCLSEMAPKYYIELFQEAELLVNITKHTLVPQHCILTREEKQTLLDRYKVRGWGRGGWRGAGRPQRELRMLACAHKTAAHGTSRLSAHRLPTLCLPHHASAAISAALDPPAATLACPAACHPPALPHMPVTAGQGHPAAAHSVQRPRGPLLWHDARPGGAHRAPL